MKKLVKNHERKLWFGLVGGSGFALSYLILALGIEVLGLNAQLAYALQMVVVVEYNFSMNYFLTWGDRKHDGSWWPAWRRFHLSKLGTIALNQLLFGALVVLGVQYLLANTVCIVITAFANWQLGNRFVFRSRPASQSTEVQLVDTPTLSVVVPVKANQDTILNTVRSLLDQEYGGHIEVILVGDLQDPTWHAVRDYIDSGAIQAFEIGVQSPGRDANAKRDFGLAQASGDLLAVVDSDMTMPSYWADRVVEHVQSGYQAIAGPFIGIGDNFWTRFIDKNPAMAKTPRMSGITVLSKDNLRWKKPPVTANFACTREVYDTVGGPNVSFTNCYEDYEWFSRIVRGGFPIVCDASLAGMRYHREGFKPLLREYIRSGKGCADHIVTHVTCGFAQTRAAQLVLTTTFMVGGVVLAGLYPLLLLAVVLGGYVLVATLTTLKVKRAEGMLYPALAAFFTSAFVYGCLSRFVRRGIAPPIPPTISGVRPAEMEVA